ncbi:hypothetical protein GCM10010274_65330 [Streptomyces lavendofoliae]|uniref:Uncharacterized protein n=1 Tax=Streptomyces lavendofoliae TaxID=67314 RepID=A0A918M8D1_9ACTN|nr:hypothetical protein GCM10010274_65330 [Streptomyces lavendofoliae]
MRLLAGFIKRSALDSRGLCMGEGAPVRVLRTSSPAQGDMQGSTASSLATRLPMPGKGSARRALEITPVSPELERIYRALSDEPGCDRGD